MKFMRADLPGLLALILVVASASALAVPSTSWRLQVSGAAESDGELVLAVTPEGGQPEEIVVAIGRADSENQIAYKAMAALQQAAGTDYEVKQDDGEDVVVTHREGVDLFEASVVRNTVEGVEVEFDPEW
jgi:outer membrane lipoprotein SlyB